MGVISVAEQQVILGFCKYFMDIFEKNSCFYFYNQKKIEKHEQLFSPVILVPIIGLSNGLLSVYDNRGDGLSAPSPTRHRMGALYMFFHLKLISREVGPPFASFCQQLKENKSLNIVYHFCFLKLKFNGKNCGHSKQLQLDFVEKH